MKLNCVSYLRKCLQFCKPRINIIIQLVSHIIRYWVFLFLIDEVVKNFTRIQ